MKKILSVALGAFASVLFAGVSMAVPPQSAAVSSYMPDKGNAVARTPAYQVTELAKKSNLGTTAEVRLMTTFTYQAKTFAIEVSLPGAVSVGGESVVLQPERQLVAKGLDKNRLRAGTLGANPYLPWSTLDNT